MNLNRIVTNIVTLLLLTCNSNQIDRHILSNESAKIQTFSVLVGGDWIDGEIKNSDILFNIDPSLLNEKVPVRIRWEGIQLIPQETLKLDLKVASTYTVKGLAQTRIYHIKNLFVIDPPPPQPPVISNLTFSKSFPRYFQDNTNFSFPDNSITISYDYYSPESITEGYSEINWFIDGILIHTGSSYTLSLSENTKNLRVQVVPKDSRGIQGDPEEIETQIRLLTFPNFTVGSDIWSDPFDVRVQVDYSLVLSEISRLDAYLIQNNLIIEGPITRVPPPAVDFFHVDFTIGGPAITVLVCGIAYNGVELNPCKEFLPFDNGTTSYVGMRTRP